MKSREKERALRLVCSSPGSKGETEWATTARRREEERSSAGLAPGGRRLEANFRSPQWEERWRKRATPPQQLFVALLTAALCRQLFFLV
ncbi:hypothetical protein V5799_012017 [Amblyomma americanum]|uniref:Uncharacterized protein n=1 Tax=Amblyomma americanum TaxID=6943 RepID=A0AAQ4EF84_AMBAM